MKFTGKELFELGVPQNKIKFYIGVEFSSKEELLEKLNESTKPKEEYVKEDTWLNWLWETFPHLPMQLKGDKKNGVPVKMSKSQLGRFMDDSAVMIDYEFPNSKTLRNGELPEEIIWFPKSNENRATW